jgi:hypothetical protein
MKNNLAATVLVGLVGVLAAVAFFLTLAYVRVTGRTPQLQAQIDEANRSVALVQSLAGEIVAYSQRNPAIDPLLQQFGLKVRTASPLAPAPAVPTAPAPAPVAPKARN